MKKLRNYDNSRSSLHRKRIEELSRRKSKPNKNSSDGEKRK